MSPDLPYHIPLAGIAAIIFLCFIISSWKHGLLRPIATMIALAGGITSGYLVFRHIPSLLEAIGIDPSPRLLYILAIALGAFLFFLLRRVGQLLTDDAYDPESAVGRIVGGPVGAFLGLIPALILIAALATGLRRVATTAELRYIDTCSALYSSGASVYPDTPYAAKLCGALESIPLSASLLDRIDPSCQIAKRHLVGLGLISRNYDLYLSIGRRNRIANEIYAHPHVTILLETLPVTKLLDAGDHEALLHNRLVVETASLPPVAENLEAISVIPALRRALGMN